MPLFRPEVARGQDTLHGEVSLVPPVSWQVLGVFLLVSVAAAAVFMSLAHYSKVTVATGIVSGDKGVIRLSAPRAGFFDQVLVQEGQTVAAQTPLARISLVTADAAGSLQAQRAQALAQQRTALSERLSGVEQGGRDRIEALRAQAAGADAEIAQLQAQITDQQALIRSAEEELSSVQSLAAQGYLTGSNLRQRQEQVASRRQSLARLQQELASERSVRATAAADIARIGAETRAGAGEISTARAELERNAAGEDVVSALLLKAPVAGTVTAVTVHPGDAATPGSPAITLLPSDTRVEAVLAVPTAAAGLLEVGQTVRVAVDAFPYQVYGSLEGKVTSISRTTVPLANRTDGAEAFMVRASIPPSITAYGAPRPLRPGMTLTARIRTRPRTLLAWLFDPILAVRRR